MLVRYHRWPAILVVLSAAALAVEPGRTPAVIRDVQRKTHDHVLLYLENTPIYREDPYYEVSVELKGLVLVGEYTPDRPGGALPEITWKAGDSVQLRLEKHFFYLLRPQGGEMKFLISERRSQKSAPKRP